MAETGASSTQSTIPCPDCGAAGAGGREGCQSIYDGLALLAMEDIRYAAVQAVGFDAYCMQHLEKYCRSAKSYAAHLTRLCCGLEFGGDAAVYAAIQRWLNGAVPLEKPPILPFLGHLTVADAASAPPEKAAAAVRAWAEDVWAAYAPQHAIAWKWIKLALEQR